MSSLILKPENLRRYLLDLSDQSEEDEIGGALLNRSAEAVEEIISSAEKTLILDYIHGRLTPQEQEKFKTHFLASPFRQGLFEEMWMREAVKLAMEIRPKSLWERAHEAVRKVNKFTMPEFALAMNAMDTAISVQARIIKIGSPDADSVTIGCGDDASVAADQIFEVFRPPADADPADRFKGPPIGTITIRSVAESRATGRFEGNQPARVGDYVKSRPRP
jgi:hypothetical protein